jgi:hypothetical protein
MPTVKRLRKKFLTALLASFAISTVILANASAAQASIIFCIDGCNGSGGETTWLSCGSSAGNYLMICPAGGGKCYSDPFVDPEANMLCASRLGGFILE